MSKSLTLHSSVVSILALGHEPAPTYCNNKGLINGAKIASAIFRVGLQLKGVSSSSTEYSRVALEHSSCHLCLVFANIVQGLVNNKLDLRNLAWLHRSARLNKLVINERAPVRNWLLIKRSYCYSNNDNCSCLMITSLSRHTRTLWDKPVGVDGF